MQTINQALENLRNSIVMPVAGMASGRLSLFPMFEQWTTIAWNQDMLYQVLIRLDAQQLYVKDGQLHSRNPLAVMEAVGELLFVTDVKWARRAVYILGEGGDKRAIPLLMLAMETRAQRIPRREIGNLVKTVLMLNPVDGPQILLNALYQGRIGRWQLNGVHRWMAETIHDPAAIPILVDLLDCEHRAFAEGAASALVGFGEQVVPDVLARYLQASSPVTDPARRVLVQLGRKSLPVLREALWKATEQENERLLLVLIRIEDPAVVVDLERLMLKGHINWRILEAMQKHGDAAVPTLERLVRQYRYQPQHAFLCTILVDVLKKINTPRALAVANLVES